MRDKEKKHRKGQETTIGKIIYGFLLFMPLIAIGVTCLTCLWNKTIESDSEVAEISYRFNTNEVNTSNDLQANNIYHYTLDFANANNGDLLICKGIFNLESVPNYYVDISTNNTFYLYKNNTSLNIYKTNPYTQIALLPSVPNTIEFDVVFYELIQSDTYNNYSISQFNEISAVNVTTQTTEFDTKNVFYYAVDKVTESPLFSWAQNSIIYTTTNSTCNALSITTPFIPLLLSYWLIISVIYFLYDIALMLVWLIHRKIHELQESL